MKDIDKLLNDEKQRMEDLEIPMELEARLFKALEGKDFEGRKQRMWHLRAMAAAVAVLLLLVSFNFSTLAYYSKRLIGFDNVMRGTLQELNQMGQGQVINKSYTFKNGIIVTLDGIMMDESQLLVFYTVTETSGELDHINLDANIQFKGLFKSYNMRHGQGEINDENTEVKWMMSFNPIAFYERSLSFNFSMKNDGEIERGSIAFKLDRAKAMKTTLKSRINKTIKVDGVKVHFDSILASPTQTVIEGSIQSLLQLAMDQLKGERIRPSNLSFRLIANGEELTSISGGMSTDMKGITFHQEFDALPKDLKSLQLHLDGLRVDRDVDEKIDIPMDVANKTQEVLNKEITINNILTDDNKTSITFTTLEDVLLSRVYLLVDGKRVELEGTDSSDYIKTNEGIYHTRTIHFNGAGEDNKLVIEKITYLQEFDIVIDIPIK